MLKNLLCPFLSLLFFILAGCSSLSRQDSSREIHIHFLNIGEGSATLVESNDLGNILIDTGNPTSQIVSKLQNMGIQRIDKLILTHPHPDHIGGAHSVIEFLTPTSIFDNGELLTFDTPELRWYKEAVRESPNYNILKRGDIFRGHSSRLTVLSPQALISDWNSNSLIMRLTAYGHTALFMADGNHATEKFLVQSAENLKADILQVGHHGALDSSSLEFLRTASPRFAVISVNKENVNGYPHNKTLKKLRDIGSTYFVTHESGRVSFTLSPDDITVSTEKDA